MSQQADVDEYPALELYRLYDRDVPRGFQSGPKGTLIPVPDDDWPSRFEDACNASGDEDALRVLRTVIVYSKLDFSVKVVAITSALPDEGKTTISMCLARVAAMSGQRVCVVDCDLRKQSINDVIDIEMAAWRDCVTRKGASSCGLDLSPASLLTPQIIIALLLLAALSLAPVIIRKIKAHSSDPDRHS